MAGIGFQLNRMARDGGIGGTIAAAIHGLAISSGPWFCTTAAIGGLQMLLAHRLDGTAILRLQAGLIYSFSASAVISAPVMLVATRMVADALFGQALERVPSILVAALATTTPVAVIAACLLFGLAAQMPLVEALLAASCLVLLSQIWICSLFLTTILRYQRVLLAFVLGAAVATPVAMAAPAGGSVAMPLLAVAGGLLVTLTTLLGTILEAFPAPPVWPADWWQTLAASYHVAIAGVLGTAAVWVDKWIIWYGPGSVVASGYLRLHPLYDSASFLGLLSLAAALVMILVVVETRFHTAFAKLLSGCTGNAVLARLQAARAEVVTALLEGGRVLVVAQGTLAFILWVTAPRLLAAVGADPRSIVPFRFVVVGCIFHMLTAFCTTILAYFDLNGRVLLIFAAFFTASAASTALTLGNFVTLGWGYLAGAVFGAVIGIACVAFAVRDLLYLLFVRNNPSILGDSRRWV